MPRRCIETNQPQKRGKIGVRLVNSLFSDQGFLSLEKREFTSLTPISPAFVADLPRQNSPTIRPSGVISILFADGIFGSPGMVMMSPQIATTNSAPADKRTSRTGTTWCLGAPFLSGSVVKLYCVFATQTGK